ncbi:unnamed protein product [Adineta steineri]|uniref:Uncharacterized protein n=1 Tax=Adineta steineri TaxID=433720 RepID=A0A813T0C0_9BILA|nr:unnamed protein product [Adineta steineri]
MEEIQYHHHHHHHVHHGHHGIQDNNNEHQYATSLHGTGNFDITTEDYHNNQQQQQQIEQQQQQQQQQQQNITQPSLSVPKAVYNVPANQTSGGGVQSTGSFHSVASLDAAAEMAKYFPDARTPSLSPSRHQLEVGGQAQSTAVSHTRTTTTTNTVNAGPHFPEFSPSGTQQLPQSVRASFMAEQQRPIRQPGPPGPTGPPGPSQLPAGIPSFPSQIEGLSVSQAVVNDVLVDLQTKVINETMQQYQEGSTDGPFFEPLPPIYIEAPQPTIILRSDINRLRAELNNSVRPQVVYRHPSDGNQFQQQQQHQQQQQQHFQQNAFQTPRFPGPSRQQVPQAESSMFNDDNINVNVQSTSDLQGLSATSFDRYASPYQPSSFHPNFEEQQQGNEQAVSALSQRISNEEVGTPDNMPIQQRQEITFDIDNCIIRCFEAHRQRLARRRAARQARRAKRHKQTGHSNRQKDQQLYQNDGYQTFSTERSYSSYGGADNAPWQKQTILSSHYSDTLPASMNTSGSVRTSEKSYVPIGEYDYANTAQSTSLSPDIPHYQSSDIVNTQTTQVPFSNLSTLHMNVASTTEMQPSATDYHEFRPSNTQETYINSKGFDYPSYQAYTSSNDLQQQSSHEQQQEQTSFEYGNQLPYPTFSSTEATVPDDIQQLTSDYYQQHHRQASTQFIQTQETDVQSSSTFDYTVDSTQSQVPAYNYQNIEQQVLQYPYNIENLQQQSLDFDALENNIYNLPTTDFQQAEQKQTFNYANQKLSSADYYQQQVLSVPISQTQDIYGQPSGSYEYRQDSYSNEGPGYDYQSIDQQSSEYPYDSRDAQQMLQQDSYNYTNANEQRQQFDYSPQEISSSDYYKQSPISQAQEPYIHPNGTYGYTTDNGKASAYDYQNIEQQPTFDYRTEDTSTYISPESNIQPTEPKHPYDFTSQALSSSDYYQQQPPSIPTSQAQGPYDPVGGTLDYVTGTGHSQVQAYDHQNTEQQSFQFPYNTENIEQQKPFELKNDDTGTYISPETNTHQTEQKQPYDYTSQALSTSDYYQQRPVSDPIPEAQETYDQTVEPFEFNKGGFKHQEPLFDYQNTDQQSSHYSYNLEDTRQQVPLQETLNFSSEATTAQSTSETDNQQPDSKQKIDYSNQTITASDQYQQKPGSIPISQIYDSQPVNRRLNGSSIPTGTVEYTRKLIYSNEPSTDNIVKDPLRKRSHQHEESETFSINDYLKRFESESYSQQTGGHVKSSDDYQSITTTTTTPNTVQPTADIYQTAGTAHTYDLKNYTNESLESGTSHPVPPTSSTCEEDPQHLLQHTSISEQIHEPVQQSELRTEVEASIYDTYSSLPPPPPPPPLPPPPPSSATKEIDHQQGSTTANLNDFPAPPTPERNSYQMTQQRPSRSFASIIPTTDQPSIYSDHQPLQLTSPTSSDNRSDEDIKEDEEIFDLRECIARCYAKYRESWNREQQRQYEQQIGGSQHSHSDINLADNQQMRTSMPPSSQQYIQQSNTFIAVHCGNQEQRQQQQQPRKSFNKDEIHCSDGWTQTASLDVMKQSNIAQHAYDQTPPSFDTKPYIPQVSSTRDFSTDSRGQQTIEYSPPLIAPQTHHVTSVMPSPTPSPYDEYGNQEQQQQQQIYDHSLPVPPHLSFNETDYQSNVSFSSQITPQRQKYENIPFHKHIDDEQQQHRYRAHSEPASIQQDSLASNPPSLSLSSNLLDQHSKRSNSIPMIHHQEQQSQLPPVRILDNGRAYETEALVRRHVPQIDPKTGLCLVPCPETQKYAHLPPHLRPELFCIELPPASSLPPVPSSPSLPSEQQSYHHHQQQQHQQQDQQQQQQQRWCVRCCCVPGKTLIKKVVYRQVDDQQQNRQEAEYDYSSMMDQMSTRISVRYGNDTMEEGEPFVTGNYCEKLRVIDFPVYVSGKNDPNLTPLVPVN